MSRSLAAALLSIVALAVLSAFAAGPASAARGTVALVTPKSVPVNYTNCSSNGTPLPCWTMSFTISNTTNYDLVCQVELANDPLVVFDTTVPAGTTTYGGGFTKGYVSGVKYLTLNMSCGDGTHAYTDTQNVRAGSL